VELRRKKLKKLQERKNNPQIFDESSCDHVAGGFFLTYFQVKITIPVVLTKHIFCNFVKSLQCNNPSPMYKLRFFFLVGFVLTAIVLPKGSYAQEEQYYDDYDREYLQSGTLVFGAQFNKFDPLFQKLNFNIFDESGAYDFTGTMDADSTNFARRSNFVGLGFNISGIQFLMSSGWRRSSPLNYFHVGFGVGFNHVLHFSYKTSQPKVWFEGLLNYNYLNSNIRLKEYDITQPPMAFFDGTQFPDIGIVAEGKYRMNVETQRHIIEPIGAFNFALSRSLGLRFAVGYSLFLNSSESKFVLRFSPDPQDNSLAKADEMVFEKTIDQINLDNRRLDAFPLDMSRWNFNVSLVFRLIGSGS